MAADIAFWVFAVVSVVAALGVVMLQDVFRAALLLVLAFFAVAGVFITLGADFLAAVQVLIYVGAIGVLLLLGIMLTRDVQRGSPASRWSIPAFILALALLGSMVWMVSRTAWHKVSPPPPEPTTAAIAQSLFDLNSGFVLPFEIASILLLAAILGAIILVRER
ncbi:MAG: NADH-quinone oxidoreductase subunit J [Chloroflexota bacterium]